MRVLGSTGVAKRVAGDASCGARRGPRAAALIAFLLLCCVLGLAATAGAAPPDYSDQASPARLALGQAELYAPDRGARDLFGWSIALSGESALTGAPGHETAGKPYAGAAYVFTRSAGIWTAPVLLTAPDGAAYDQFGTSVALSGDTALVGAPIHEVAGKVGAGAVYVFTLTGGSWTPQATLTAAGGATYDFFGDVRRPLRRDGVDRRGQSRHRGAGKRRRRLRLHPLRQLLDATADADRPRRRRPPISSASASLSPARRR